MNALDLLDELALVHRELGSRLAPEVARRAAPGVEAALRATADAGESPDGKPWAARKDGGRAYAGAAARINVKANGTVIRATLDGPEVFGHFGARGAPVRQMLPDPGSIPDAVAEAIRKAAAEVLEEALP